jgi:hypothetical protein
MNVRLLIDNSNLYSINVKIKLYLNELIGLCPKYITKRSLYYNPKIEKKKIIKEIKYQNNIDFPKECIELINTTSTSFLATIGKKHMGINHRGGNPGFLRYNNGNIYLPEYSGNKYYSSLGNIE